MPKRLTKMNRTVIQSALWFLEAGEFDEETHGFTRDDLGDALDAILHWKVYGNEELEKRK